MSQFHSSSSGCRPVVTLVHRWQQKEKFSSFESIHPDWLVFVVEDGSFHYRIGAEEGTASYGDLVFCPPETVFRRVVIHPVSLFVVFFHWQGGNRPGESISPGEASGLPSGKISLRHTSRLQSTLRLMRDAYLSDDMWNLRRLEHYVDDLWLQYCSESGQPPESAGELPSAPADGLVREAAGLIARQAFSPLRLQDTAASLGTSLSALSKRFKKACGCTPIQYLTRLRMEKAKTLLLETGLTIDQISECCGYQNGFYLTRVFIKHYGMPPAQFRKNHSI